MFGSLLALLILSSTGTDLTLPPVSKIELGSGLLTKIQSDLTKEIDERGVEFTRDDQLLTALRNAGAQDKLLDAVSHSKVYPRNETSAEKQAFSILLGCASLEHKRNIAAIAQCEAAIEVLPNNALVLTAVAFEEYRYNCASPWALNNIQKAVRLAPELSEAHRIYGLLLSCSQKPSLQEFQKAIKLDPGNARTHFDFGMYCGSADERALPEMRLAATLDPTNGYYRFWIGQFLESQGRVDDAFREYKEAENVDPQYPEPYMQRAGILAERKQYEEAIQEAQRAVAANPQFMQSHLTLASVLFLKGDFEQGLDVLQAAARSIPNDSNAYFRLINILGEKGDLTRAVTVATEAVARDPQWETIFRRQLAHFFEKGGDYPDALDQFQRLVEIQGDTPQLQEAIGRLNAELQRN